MDQELPERLPLPAGTAQLLDGGPPDESVGVGHSAAIACTDLPLSATNRELLPSCPSPGNDTHEPLSVESASSVQV